MHLSSCLVEIQSAEEGAPQQHPWQLARQPDIFHGAADRCELRRDHLFAAARCTEDHQGPLAGAVFLARLKCRDLKADGQLRQLCAAAVSLPLSHHDRPPGRT